MTENFKFKNLTLKSRERGFTLIELLVVATIVMVLSIVIMVNIEKSRARARDTQRKSILSQYAQALEAYKADNKKYPAYPGCQGTSGVVIVAPYTNFPTSGVSKSIADVLVDNKYLQKVLTDPSGNSIIYKTDSETSALEFKIVVKAEGISTDDLTVGDETCQNNATTNCCETVAKLKNTAGDFCNPVDTRADTFQVSSSSVSLPWAN